MSGRWQSETGADDMFCVGEVLHRVANEYTNAISFAYNVAADSDSEETKTAVRKIAYRLHGLAETRRSLSPAVTDQPTDFADSLSHLCQDPTITSEELSHGSPLADQHVQ